MDQKDCAAVESLLPFGLKEGQQCCLTKQMDLVSQMDWGLALHKQAAGQLDMLLHHTNCSE